MTLDGQVIEVGKTTINKDTAIKKFAIKTSGKYPQEIEFTLLKDNCDFIDDTFIGSKVEVDFVIKGSKWQDKRFVSLIANKIVETDKSDTPYVSVVKNAPELQKADDELPF